ncbi:hypothetical protein [Streptomyces sp. CB03911]|uniref:hypothetical protein n=1 Tax=Streptomycetaceae TaxID=2062 RepID=UPI00093B7B82|nr:hypothetical protein [Streptomyces sp. CB03911]OKI12567.1 hypothetical protein A6A07_16860 [Streptomyces sp. CB03911]
MLSGTDVTTLVVAVVGVGGTIGATALAQRARRAEVAEQNRRAALERQQDREERGLQTKRELYAALNATGRAYRSAGRDTVLALRRGETVATDTLDATRQAYYDQYAQAQMILGTTALDVAGEVNQCLGAGYHLIRNLPIDASGAGSLPPADAQLARAKRWFSGPLSDAVHLLREALRAELGVSGAPSVEQLTAGVVALSRAREALRQELRPLPAQQQG